MNMPATLLIVTTSYPRWGNGREAAGSFVADLAAELARHVRVRVVAPGDDAKLENPGSDLCIYRYPAPRTRMVNLRFWNPFDAWRILRALRAGRIAVRRAVEDRQVGHILALWALPSGHWARVTRRRTGIPYSVWMLGSDVWTLGRLPVVRGVLRGVMRGASRRYADGLQLASDSESICEMPVAFLPSTRELGLRDPPQPASRAPYRLVFIGRWHRNKGIDLMMDALALLNDSDWRRIAGVEIYGGGPLQPQVHAKARCLLDAGRPLKIGGFIPKAEAEHAIIRGDWVVIPSRVESIPVIFSDAMKLGRPVIAMPVGDLPRLIGEYPCGMLANNVSGEALAEAIRSAVQATTNSFREGIALQARRFNLPLIAKGIIREVLGSE